MERFQTCFQTIVRVEFEERVALGFPGRFVVEVADGCGVQIGEMALDGSVRGAVG